MRTVPAFFFSFLLAMPAFAQTPTYQDRLYGRATTRDGDVLEGFIRWDKNEAGWLDVLDGSKRIEHTTKGDRRSRSISIFGIEIEWGDDEGSSIRSSGIRFGHLQSLQKNGSNAALLTLRSGQEIELRGGSTDIGNDVRGIIIEDKRGPTDLGWRDVERIDFMPVPRGVYAPGSGERLYGTLTTRNGLAFTGFICWDVDEVLGADLLDGEDERGRDHEIPFADIAEIARESARSARVTLKTGEVLILHGSNDVNSSNRDILVLDPALGQVRVPWKAFDAVVFKPSGYTYSYDRFYTSGPLTGAVETRDGDVYAGAIRWDDDEAYSWEFINGDVDDLDFSVELGLVRRIERVSPQAALVTLADSRAFELHGSNDVNDDNSGIFVTTKDGDEVYVSWGDFRAATFEKQ